LKNLKDKIYSKLGIKSDRTKNITKHVMFSALFKGGSILASFLLVPLTIDYLDTENYGVWLTLSSFIAWFSFFDIGLGNGLRNKFAVAKANGDTKLAKAYVSSAYYTIGAVSLGLIVVFFIINSFIDWSQIFNTTANLQKELSILMPIVFGFFCLQLVVKLITTIYTADQQHSTQGKIHFLTSVSSLVVIWVLTKTSESSLLLFGAIFSILPVFILFGFNFIGFNKRYVNYKPSFRLWKKEYLKDIFGLGVKFFVVQIAWVIITTTDNFIITQLFSPSDVVPYNIASKYFSIATMGFSIIVTPYWSSFTEAYEKGELKWIRKSMNNLYKFILFFIVTCLFLLLISDFMYKVWVGDSVVISFGLSGIMCIYSCMIIFLTPFNYFLNGIGKIKIQLVQTVVMSVINIPISYYFAVSLGFGVNGVALGTIVSIAPSLVLSTIQFNLITKNKAIGIWNN
jgi:O-antigen/teichoic acid export membrane protein